MELNQVEEFKLWLKDYIADFYGDDENFLEYENNMKEYRKPTANKYNILNLREFANHGYDLDKRKEKEENRKF